MPQMGAQAPSFSLVGVEDEEQTRFSLTDYTADGSIILLLFYPFDFSPICTTELCSIRDAEWFSYTENLQVWAISTDSVYSHSQFSEEYDIGFPLLSDTDGSVASKYNVCYDEWEGHKNVPKRAVFLIDSAGTIQYSWATDDAYNQPELTAINEALLELVSFHETLTADDIP
ncbi:redoxin domain-containing protein [Haladaptatus sp. ZSTT2]|uniref:redoxin domain-containing protein n=1 Tax=Haladaptatus sp. ZSTT2 TaxID=3120515 RepID=UPI00300EF117